MDHIVIAGAKPYDGRYEFSLESLTTREWGFIKRLAGYRPAELDDDSWSDPELACVLAVIMLRRAGRIEPREVPEVFERLIDAPFDTTIRIEVGDEPEVEDDVGPPLSSSNGNASFSGDSGSPSSETSPPTPPAGGTIGSDTSASHPATRLVT